MSLLLGNTLVREQRSSCQGLRVETVVDFKWTRRDIWGEISVLYLAYRGRCTLIIFMKTLRTVHKEGTFSVWKLCYFKRRKQKELGSSHVGDSYP